MIIPHILAWYLKSTRGSHRRTAEKDMGQVLPGDSVIKFSGEQKLENEIDVHITGIYELFQIAMIL